MKTIKTKISSTKVHTTIISPKTGGEITVTRTDVRNVTGQRISPITGKSEVVNFSVSDLKCLYEISRIQY